MLVAGFATNSSAQQLPGDHPYYLHALSDLRAARWFLYHQPGDAGVYAGEDVGIREIDAAIGEMKRPAIDDGKDINDHPATDVRDHGSRLLKSIRILDHGDRAEHAAEEAHGAWMKEKNG